MGAKGKNFYNSLMRRYGWEAEAERIQELYLGGQQREAIAAVPDELVDAVALVGPKERIRDRLEAWRETPVTTLIVGSPQPEALAGARRARPVDHPPGRLSVQGRPTFVGQRRPPCGCRDRLLGLRIRCRNGGRCCLPGRRLKSPENPAESPRARGLTGTWQTAISQVRPRLSRGRPSSFTRRRGTPGTPRRTRGSR